MAKKFLFILDPLEKLNIKADTSLALIQESCSRNIKTYVCELKDIFLKDGQTYFMSSEVKLEVNYKATPNKHSQELFKADEFAAIFMRKDPPVDANFISALYMLRCVDTKKTLLINHPDGMLLANEKLFGQKIAPLFYTKTLVSNDQNQLREFIKEHEKVVLKPLYNSGGEGVLVTEHEDKNLLSMLELLSKNYSRPVMVQKFIKNARLGDKRIIILGGEAKGAINRIPNTFDHRANFHAGGLAEACDITEAEYKIVEAIKPELLRLGLYLVGIDVIAGFLSEINVTSPTCVIEIEKTQKTKLRAEIIDYVLSLLAT
jgi:glutathione synthase